MKARSFSHNNALPFVACISDDELLQRNLLGSQCLDPRFHHEVVIVKNCPSAAAGLNIALTRAEREFVVCVHQDIFLPVGWDRCLMEQLEEAGRRFGPIGVAGVYGVGEVIAPEDPTQPLRAQRIGWVNDRGRVLRDGPELPARVATLDEIVLVVRRDSDLRFDPELGFHLYGADIYLQAANKGWPWSHWPRRAITIRAASDCRRRFSRALGFSPANGATGCQWRRRASSSTARRGFSAG